MIKKKKTIILLIIAAAILLPLVIWTLWSNTALQLTEYTVSDPDLPAAFDGYRIAQISDLHNAQMGDHNENLLAMLRKAQPDMIALTGDLIDSRNTDVSITLEFVEEAMKIAPCYYVTGNHESRVEEYAQLKSGLLELGVVVLQDAQCTIDRAGEEILVIGIDDPSYKSNYIFGNASAATQQTLQKLPKEDHYAILLSHRPELMEVYAQYDMDLVLSGHAHGGQFRLPWIGGIYAPGQGLLPEYDAGLFYMENTQMIVSRGIGNSVIPLRFNNRPEVVLITLTQ